MRLTDGRLKICSIKEEQLEWVRNLHNDPDVLSMLTDPHVVSVEEQIKWFNKLKTSSSSDRCVVEDTGICCDNLVGVVRIDSFDSYNKSVCIGLDIHKDFRGRGYAKPIYHLLLNHFFSTLALNRVWLLVAEYNTIAKGLYKSLGFVEEGVQRQALYRNEKFYDYIMMSVLSEEYNVAI